MRIVTAFVSTLKAKAAKISGLQLTDLLGHPLKQWVLRESGLLDGEASAFVTQITEIAKTELNQQLYTGKIEGYGTVLFPKKKGPLARPFYARPYGRSTSANAD